MGEIILMEKDLVGIAFNNLRLTLSENTYSLKGRSYAMVLAGFVSDLFLQKHKNLR